MLKKVFDKLKERLAMVPDVKLVDWFNNQYEGVIHAAPCIFVDFPKPITMGQLRGRVQHGLLTVRIHAVSKVVNRADYSIDPAGIELHEVLVDNIYAVLQQYSATENGSIPIFGTMSRNEVEHHPYNKGWMITTQDFVCLVNQNEVSISAPITGIEIEMVN